jgi:hypothetical protein
MRHFVSRNRDPLAYAMETDRARPAVLARAVAKRSPRPVASARKRGGSAPERPRSASPQRVHPALRVLGFVLILRAIVRKNISTRRDPR